MIGREIKFFDNQALSEYMAHLDRQLQKAAAYDALSKSVPGQSLISDLRGDLAWYRKSYRGLISEDDKVGVALNGIQAIEFYIERLLLRLTEFNELAETVSKEKSAIIDEVKQRQERAKQEIARFSFLGSGQKGE